MCAIESQDTMKINYIWNHYFLTDALSRCSLFILLFYSSAAECAPLFHLTEVRIQNYEPVCWSVCLR